MGYARGARGVYPWASGDVIGSTPPGQVLPPPIPGGTTSYTYATANGEYPWSYGGWAGGLAPVAGALFGGVIIAPDQDNGVMRITAWWPDAGTLNLVRIQPDNTRVAVRGAYPLTVSGTTRRNLAPNPSAVAGLNGYVPADGNPTLATITDAPVPPGKGIRCTVAAAGTCGLTIPTTLAGLTPGQIVTVGMGLRFATRPTSVTVTISWTDSTGTALPASTLVLSSDQVNASVGQWSRQVVSATAPSGSGTISAAIKVAAAGLPAGGTMDVARQTHEIGQTNGSYVDGDTLGGVWVGTAGLSTSIVAPVQTVVDGEAPLDVPLTYQVNNSAVTGGLATSATATLGSGDMSWLTHPAFSSTPVRARVTAAPEITRAAQSATFAVIGRPNPVVVSAGRSSATGSLVVDTPTFGERDALLGLLADGLPMLLRAPGDYGLGYGWWIAVGDVTENPGGRPQWSPGRALTLPFTVVDAPLGPSTFAAA